MEKRLAEDLGAAGYDVMNAVRSKAVLDEALYEQRSKRPDPAQADTFAGDDSR